MNNPLIPQAIQAQQTTPQINSQAIQSVKNMMNMLRTAQDPQKAIELFAQQNPQIAQIVQMANGDFKGLYYAECQKRGINPEEYLKQFE